MSSLGRSSKQRQADSQDSNSIFVGGLDFFGHICISENFCFQAMSVFSHFAGGIKGGRKRTGGKIE